MKSTYTFLFIITLILLSNISFSQSVPSYVPTNGLVGWWGFNGNAQDGSGNGNHGTVNGATLTTDRFGNQNGAYSFDGSSAIITVPNSNSISIASTNQLSIQAWAMKTGNQSTMHVLGKRVNGCGSIEYQFGYCESGSCHLATVEGIGFGGMPGSYVLSGLVLNAVNWYHFVGTFNGLTWKLYVNGTYIDSVNNPSINPNIGDLIFGASGTCPKWQGFIDDIGIWNRALTPQEITNLYNSQVSQPCTTSVTTSLNINGCGFAVLSNGDTVTQTGNYLDTLSTLGGCDSIINQSVTIQPSSNCNPIPSYVPTNGLVGWWGFNGNAQDGSGNGNHGTVNGATLTTDRFGNQNGAYDFDGVNDFIVVSSLNNYQYKPVTYHLWIRPDSLNHIAYALGGGVVLVGRDWSGNYDQGALMIYDHPASGINNEILYYIGQSGLITGYTPQVSIWNSVTMTITSNDTICIFVNGSLVTKQFFPTNSNVVAPFKFGAGTEPNQLDSRFLFNGKIDDIGIWNRALTQQEITNLYNSQLPTQTSLCLPTITTTSPTSVGVDTVVIGGDISNDGGSAIVLRGVCYSTSPNPNMGNMRTEDGSGIGSFNTVLRGLNPSTTYYARKYAKNSNGVVVYGNEVSFTTSAVAPSFSCGTSTVSDVDNNTYNTVQIGNQCWTQSNLKVSKYRNGDNIPTGLSNADWENTTSGAYAIYNNDPVNDSLFGKLYNHYAVTDSRGVCPTGWHVPSDGEWTVLVKYLDPNANTVCGSCVQSGTAGGALKSTAMQPTLGGWNTPNAGATNSSGFTALPGGRRTSGGDFNSMTDGGHWWSSSVSSASDAWLRGLIHYGSTIHRSASHGPRATGFSVRCLKNTLPQVNTSSVTGVTHFSALVTGEVISEGDQNTTWGICYSTSPNPNISNDTTMNGTGTGVYSNLLQNLTPLTTYYVRAYATNRMGTSYGNEVSFTTDSLPGLRCPGTPTVTDIDGNTYYTVQIGNQCWTQSNLKVSKYRNGDTISTGLSDAQWSSTSSGAYAIYDNDPANDGLYGKLYNHYAVTDSRGLCPTGWHVPTNGEWTILENHLGGYIVAGGALKSTAMQPTPGGWASPNTGATNSSGFTAPPGGFRTSGGDFNSMTGGGYWWSSSVLSASLAWYRVMYFNSSVTSSATANRRTGGFSVRCLKD